MIKIIGNALNSCNKKVLDKMNKRDFEFVKKEIIAQVEHGASFIELNAVSLLDKELPFLEEAIPLAEEHGAGVLVRSNSVEILKAAINMSTREIIIGDIEYDRDKIDALTDLIKEKDVKIIARINEPGDSEEIFPEKSLLIAQMYVDYLLDKGIKRKNILLDPIVRPLEPDFSNGKAFLNTLELFKLDFPMVKTVAHINNLSEGLPKRHLLNSYFFALAIDKGLDYIALNVLEKNIPEALVATLAIIGKDRNLQNYMKFCRNSKEAKRKGA